MSTDSGKKRHKKVLTYSNGGVSLGCEHCDNYGIKHPTKVMKNLGNMPVDMWDRRDTTSIKEAWDFHKLT